MRLAALIDHLPDTAVMVFDSQLVLESVSGPGARTWRYAERNVTPGWRLADMMPTDVLAILEPHYKAALAENADRWNTTPFEQVLISRSRRFRWPTQTVASDTCS